MIMLFDFGRIVTRNTWSIYIMNMKKNSTEFTHEAAVVEEITAFDESSTESG
jgi:hypothetical protein